MQNESKSLRLVPFFSALCLFLAAVEYAIPKPLPFMRLGIANLPVMVSLSVMKKRETLLLILFKVLAQSLITGTLFSYIALFSVAGSFASGLGMMGLYALFGKNQKISNVGLSLAGALANNAAQIALGYAIVFGENTRYIAPLLLAVGTVSGLIMGLFANAFCKRSEWYKRLTSGGVFVTAEATKTGEVTANSHGELGKQATTTRSESRSAKMQFIIAVILFPVFMFHRYLLSIATKIFQLKLSAYNAVAIAWIFVAVFLLMTLIKRRGKVKILPSVFITIFITLFALLSPTGKILYAFGKFVITEDALLLGLRKSATLVGMVFLSQFAISPRLELPGKVGKFMQEVFSIFDSLTSERIKFRRGHIIASLDARLCELMKFRKSTTSLQA